MVSGGTGRHGVRLPQLASTDPTDGERVGPPGSPSTRGSHATGPALGNHAALPEGHGLRSRLASKALTIGACEPWRGAPSRNAAIDRESGGPQQGLVWLRDSGYARLTAGPAVLLVDVGSRSRNRFPTLSFELSLGGQRVILNHGASDCGPDDERLDERGWAAGSTVRIDGVDSNSVRGRFWAAPRARPFDIRAEQTENGFRVSTLQDGSNRLSRWPVHRRTWELSPQRLVVIDTIVGEFREAVARFHLHSDVQAEGEGEQGRLRLPDRRYVRWRVSDGEARIVAERWHPEPGVSVAGRCLEVRFSGNACRTELEWAPKNPHDYEP